MKKQDKLNLLLAVMTAVQRRRWMLYLKGRTLRHIAQIEGVSYQAVQNALRRGKKKAKFRLEIYREK